MSRVLPRGPRRSSLARRGKAATREVAALARALGHPARIRIVQTLIAKQACIGCDLVDEIGLAQSTISEHLRILKAAGIITGEIERPRVCYSLNATALLPLRRFLAAAESPGQSRSSAKPEVTAPGRSGRSPSDG